MWNDPAGLAAADRQCNCGANAVRRYGDTLWAEVEFRRDRQFIFDEIADALAIVAGLSGPTAANYTKAFFAYTRAAGLVLRTGHRYEVRA